MTDSAEQVYQGIMGGYRDEQRIYEELLDLANRQFDLLSKGEQETVVEVVAEKGKRIARIQQIEEGLTEWRTQWPEVEPGISESNRQALDQQVARLRVLIQSILERDEESEVLMKNWAQKATGKMHQMRQSRAATQAYLNQKGQAGSMGPCLFDKKE